MGPISSHLLSRKRRFPPTSGSLEQFQWNPPSWRSDYQLQKSNIEENYWPSKKVANLLTASPIRSTIVQIHPKRPANRIHATIIYLNKK